MPSSVVEVVSEAFGTPDGTDITGAISGLYILQDLQKSVPFMV